jgi:hypothetical protein
VALAVAEEFVDFLTGYAELGVVLGIERDLHVEAIIKKRRQHKIYSSQGQN